MSDTGEKENRPPTMPSSESLPFQSVPPHGTTSFDSSSKNQSSSATSYSKTSKTLTTATLTVSTANDKKRKAPTPEARDVTPRMTNTTVAVTLPASLVAPQININIECGTTLGPHQLGYRNDPNARVSPAVKGTTKDRYHGDRKRYKRSDGTSASFAQPPSNINKGDYDLPTSMSDKNGGTFAKATQDELKTRRILNLQTIVNGGEQPRLKASSSSSSLSEKKKAAIPAKRIVDRQPEVVSTMVASRTNLKQRATTVPMQQKEEATSNITGLPPPPPQPPAKRPPVCMLPPTADEKESDDFLSILDSRDTEGKKTGSITEYCVVQTDGSKRWIKTHELTNNNTNRDAAIRLATYALITKKRVTDASSGETKIVALIDLPAYKSLKNFLSGELLSVEKLSEIVRQMKYNEEQRGAGKCAPKITTKAFMPIPRFGLQGVGEIICKPNINCMAASMASCAIYLDKKNGGIKYPNTEETVDYVASQIAPNPIYASNGDLINFVKGEQYDGKPVFDLGRMSSSYHNNIHKILCLQGGCYLIVFGYKVSGDDLRMHVPHPPYQNHSLLYVTDVEDAEPGVLGMMLDSSKGNRPYLVTEKHISSKENAKQFFYDLVGIADNIEITDTYCIYPHGECPPGLEGEFGPELFGMSSSKVKRRSTKKGGRRRANFLNKLKAQGDKSEHP